MTPTLQDRAKYALATMGERTPLYDYGDWILERFETIREALRLAADPWMPIETAPKDGTAVLGYFPSRRGYVASQEFVPIHWSGWGGGVWENSTSGGRPVDKPTHWMPLPAAPVATTEVEK
jgi:hypothetical protein